MSGPDETLRKEGVATTVQRFAPGSVADGRFRIVRFIAAGGMGEVYAAHDLVLDAKVALKTLRPELESSATAIERLRREIALARNVTNEHICRLHDVGEHEGRVFLTMELLEGATLSELARENRLPVAEVDRIARQLVDGLAALHRASIVHRDFKTGNVLVVGDRVIITDFGLARSVAGGDSTLTSEAGLIGTPAYMAPEQVEGRLATHASDIYALGVVLFELLTGQLPFSEETPLATATARLHRDPPRPSSIRKDVPARWDAIVLACLARDPAGRPARVEDVLRQTHRSRRVAPLVVGAVALAGAATWFLTMRSPDAPQAEQPPAARALQYFQRTDDARARTIFEQLVSEHPDNPWLHFQLARTLYFTEDMASAKKHIAIAVARRGALSLTDQLRVDGWSHDLAGDLEQALTITGQIVERPDADVDDILQRSRLLVFANRDDEALTLLTAATQRFGLDPRLDLDAAAISTFAAQVRLSTTALAKACAIGSPSMQAQAVQFRAQGEMGLLDLDMAEHDIDQAVGLFQAAGESVDVSDAYATKSAISASRGHYADALRWIDRAIDSSPIPAGREDHLVSKAVLLATLGRHDEAARAMAEVTDGAFPVMRAEIVALRGDDAEARRLLDANPRGNVARRAWLQARLDLHAGELAQADQELSRAVANPDQPRVLMVQMRITLAQLRLAQGRFAEADTIAGDAISTLEEHGSIAMLGFAYATKATARRSSGNLAGARETLELAQRFRDHVENPAELAVLSDARAAITSSSR